ncbi:hypothetical protein BCR44DRAFT_1437930 [Catenaria anguillulae PL171]|uniref:Uncharacterized protein n=1 Tax=Catenaria anguillulae PL171 TaxID=765915 RepID=A0A1Y2HGF5_9FUNG|nr:hypothetical protein BCR44DRAFT_1437930 [Catenaria anguillulae PL171]
MTQDPPPPPYPIHDGSADTMIDQLRSWKYASQSELAYFAFLCMAERRYTAWMHALATAIDRDEQTGLIVSPPLPQSTYMDDMYCVFPGVWQMHQIQFPILALAQHLDQGLVHADSERFWAEYVSDSEPYAPTAYVQFRVNGHPLRCLSCLESVSVMQTSTARLLDALSAFRAMPSTHRLPGCHFDPRSMAFSASANRDTLRSEQAQDIQRKTLSMDELLRPVVGPVAKTHLRVAGAKHPNVHRLFSRLVASYQNVPVGPWSLDLVQAVLRQRRFADKMAHSSVQDIASDFCVRARTAVQCSGSDTGIDLAWHTHQMLSSKYVEFTTRFTGKVVDHHDSVGKKKLRNAVHETGVLWFDTFQAFWTSDRLVPLLLLPPVLGLVQLYQSMKHKQAINDAGDCAAHPPSATVHISRKQAYAAFTRNLTSKQARRSQPASVGDPTKSSRDTAQAPDFYFYSGHAAQGGVGFSVRTVNAAVEVPS